MVEIRADRLVAQRREGQISIGDGRGPILVIRLPMEGAPQHTARAWQFLNDLREAADRALNDLPALGQVRVSKGG